MVERSHGLNWDRYTRIVFRELPGAVWSTDRDLCLTYVTGRLATNAGLRVRPGMTVFDILGTHDPANLVIACHRAALSGEPQSFEYRFLDHWYSIFIEQLTDESGAVVGCIAAGFDNTEQRLTKERLARSEALLAQAQKVAHIGSFEWDVTSNTVTWSDELHRIYGLEPGQFKGNYESYLEHVAPDDLERTKGALFDALRKGGPFVYDHRIIRKDGSERVLHTRGDVIKDEGGLAMRVAGCCWDVTELKRSMDGLQRARSLLEATIEATADGLLVVDRDGKLATYNQRLLSLWNIPPDLARQGDDKLLLTYVRDQLEDADAFSCSTREIYTRPERESLDVLRLKDDRVFERYSAPQRIGEQIVGRVWSFRDITEREKLLRRATFLADATRLLGSLDVEPALDSVAHLAVPYMGDVCAIDLFGNGQPRRLLVVSREGRESFTPELPDAVMAGHSTSYSIGTRSCMAVPLIVKAVVVGAMTFVGARTRRYHDQDVAFAESLARRAALSVENAHLYREVRDALHARDEFVAIAAHEIRGPITSVHMAVQGLKRGKVPAAATTKVFDIIEREDRRLARFVDELLDLGRIQSGQIHFTYEEADLGDVVRDAVRNLSAELTRSESALSITTDGHPVGQWDRFRLEQVATNLLANAIKFGEGRPISISVQERLGVTALTVKDQGIGIPAERLEDIFKPFGRAVPSRHYGGLGLGLFIVRTIVEGLGGTIHVESKPQEGSAFTVELRNVRSS